MPRGRLLAYTPRLLGIPMIDQLLDAVHQAVQTPLRVGFRLAAQRERFKRLLFRMLQTPAPRWPARRSSRLHVSTPASRKGRFDRLNRWLDFTGIPRRAYAPNEELIETGFLVARQRILEVRRAGGPIGRRHPLTKALPVELAVLLAMNRGAKTVRAQNLGNEFFSRV